MNNTGLCFNGTNSYCEIPISVTSATSWKVTITFIAYSTSSGSQIYNQPCIFGFDSGGYKSRDFHIDIKAGNLFIFSGLSGTNNASQLVYGTLTNGSGDFGWDTQKYVSDKIFHVVEVEVSYTEKKLSVYLDNEYLGYLNIVNTINSSVLYLGASYTGEKKYAKFDLFEFELNVDGNLAVEYLPTETAVTTKSLTDSSGNNRNGVLHGDFSVVDNDELTITPKLLVTTVPQEASVTPKLFVTTVPYSTTVTVNSDTKRSVYIEETTEFDTEREVTDGVSTVTLRTDTKRKVFVEYIINADTSRTIKTYSYLYFNTERTVVNASKVEPSVTNTYHNVLTLAPLYGTDFSKGVKSEGTYQIPAEHQIINNAGSMAYIDVDIDAETFNVSQWIDSVRVFDDIINFDGGDVGNCVTITPYVRTSDDGTTFGNWQYLYSGSQYKGKYYDFKLKLSTTNYNITPVVKKFGYTVHS